MLTIFKKTVALNHFLWTSIHTLFVGFVRLEPDSFFRRNMHWFPIAGISTLASLGLNAFKGSKLSQSDDAIFGNSLKDDGKEQKEQISELENIAAGRKPLRR
jgi:hypothetical protein